MSPEDIELIRWAGSLIRAQAISERNDANRLSIAYSDREFTVSRAAAADAKMNKGRRLVEIAEELEDNNVL